jgi:hypothetical protein
VYQRSFSQIWSSAKSAIICSCCRTKSEFGISGSDAARSMAKKLRIVVLDDSVRKTSSRSKIAPIDLEVTICMPLSESTSAM